MNPDVIPLNKSKTRANHSMAENRPGVCVQTRLYHQDSLIRLANGLMSTSYWKLTKVNIGDEIAVFDLGADSGATAIATGNVICVHRHQDDGQQGRVTIIFTVTDDLVYRDDVVPSRNSHYYEILADGTRRPKNQSES